MQGSQPEDPTLFETVNNPTVELGSRKYLLVVSFAEALLYLSRSHSYLARTPQF